MAKFANLLRRLSGEVKIRIYYEDTDCGGVVYYANYLAYMERARTEYLRERKIELKALVIRGISFTVSRVEIDYIHPAMYDDMIRIDTKHILGRASMTFLHEIHNDNQLIVTALCRMACVKRDGKPVRVPEEVKNALS